MGGLTFFVSIDTVFFTVSFHRYFPAALSLCRFVPVYSDRWFFLIGHVRLRFLRQRPWLFIVQQRGQHVALAEIARICDMLIQQNRMRIYCGANMLVVGLKIG